jgi:hypothetical protein
MRRRLKAPSPSVLCQREAWRGSTLDYGANVGAIFISYRRHDTEGESGRLFDDLVREFGARSLFMDVATSGLATISGGRSTTALRPAGFCWP